LDELRAKETEWAQNPYLWDAYKKREKYLTKRLAQRQDEIDLVEELERVEKRYSSTLNKISAMKERVSGPEALKYTLAERGVLEKQIDNTRDQYYANAIQTGRDRNSL
jgi:hypothetical protein